MSAPKERRKVGQLQSSPIITRYSDNPVLKPADIPYESKLTYNPGVAKHKGEYTMVFRNDYGWNEEIKKPPKFSLGLARSSDGIHWKVHPEPILEGDGGEVLGSIDPRLMWSDGRFFLSYAQFTRHGFRATIATTKNFKTFTFIDRSLPDNRDGVLFPQKFGDKYLRIDRPFTYFSRDNKVYFDIWISESPDLIYWGKSEPLLCVEDVPFANERIGAGSPPVRTDAGWLVLFHAVDVDTNRGKNGLEDKWQSRYTIGAMLLDLKNPRRVIGSSQTPLLVPEAPYEIAEGFRCNVIFPTALVAEEDETAKIYYGAADTVAALATAQIEDLIHHCLQGKQKGPRCTGWCI